MGIRASKDVECTSSLLPVAKDIKVNQGLHTIFPYLSAAEDINSTWRTPDQYRIAGNFRKVKFSKTSQ